MRISADLKRRLMLPLVLGLCDGIITVLTFIANRLVQSNEFITFSFAIRISIAAFITGTFVYSIAQYTELRRQLLHAERQLNLTKSGHLATTALGKQIIFETILSTIIASVASFLGAFIPILVAMTLQEFKWASIVTAFIALGTLGIFLAKLVYGSKVRWALALILSGLLISFIGMQLNIVG